MLQCWVARRGIGVATTSGLSRHNAGENMVDLLLTIRCSIIIIKMRGRGTAESICYEQFLSRFLNNLKIKPLELEPHPLDPWRTGSDRLVQEAH